MPHDKIKAATRQRMAETGEPYAAARRAVLAGHLASAGQAPAGQGPPREGGYALAMSGEIHHWLAELGRSDPPAALRVAGALVTLMEKGPGLSEPLVTSTAGNWPWALVQALDRSYQERLDRVAALRRGEADAATLIGDLRGQIAALQATQAGLEDQHRRALEAGRSPETAGPASHLAAVQQQLAAAEQMLARMIDARRQLHQATQRLQARADAQRTRKESLKASYTAASGSLRVHETLAALGLADDGTGQDHDGTGQAASTPQARLAGLIAQMERELGQHGSPGTLMDLHPGAPWRSDISILFAVEPPGTALLIAVLQGLDVVADQLPEALLASADRLRQVRAGQAPDAAAHSYPDTQSFLGDFHPGGPAADSSPP